MERKYEQIVRFVQETPWAVRPDMLLTIRGIVAARMAGIELESVQAAKRPQSQNKGAVAVLPLWGAMVPHAGMMTEVSGGVALDSWIQDFRALVADPSISTIILDIDSPGGAVSMVSETAAEIRAANARKKIIAVANPQIASAAYWLASQASEIVSPASGNIGSVGVIAEHTDVSEMEAAAGVVHTYITAGEFKAEQLGPLSEEAKAAIQNKVDQAYVMFVGDIAKGRGVSASQVAETYGKGRMLTARDALAVGMIDRIGTLDAVIAREVPGGKRPALRAANEDVELEGEGAAEMDDSSGDWNGNWITFNPALVPATAISATSSGTGGNLLVVPFTTTTTTTSSDANTIESEVNDDSGNMKNTDTNQIQGSASRGALTDSSKEGKKMDERMTLEQLAARKEEVLARMGEIHTDAQGRHFVEEEQFEFDELDSERQEIESAMENIQERETRLAAALGTHSPRRSFSGDGAKPTARQRAFYTNGGVNLPDNIYDLSAYRGFTSSIDEMHTLYREGARRAIEGLAFEANSDKARDESEKLLGRDADSAFARRVLTTGNPLYDRAFGKTVMGKPLSSQEETALKAAVSETGLGSELPVPVTIDPTVLLTSDGAVNPLRQIARTVTITGNTWQGISSEGVTVAYEAELSQVADQTPQYAAPVATVAKAHGYVEFSIEVDQDWGELRSNLRLMFQDAKDMKEADVFLFGSGTNEPEGLITALVADGGSTVETDTVNTLAVGDLYKLKSALPPRFRSGASWLANDTIYSLVRQFDTAGGSSLWAQLAADRPAVLLGKPIYEASEMSDLATTGGEDIAIYGDFGRGFVIVDRVGLNVELIPHVLGANRRPIGARALYCYFRNTSTLLAANAFRMLRVKNT